MINFFRYIFRYRRNRRIIEQNVLLRRMLVGQQDLINSYQELQGELNRIYLAVMRNDFKGVRTMAARVHAAHLKKQKEIAAK